MYSPGDRLDRFEVVSVLGSGGSAVVYRVRHLLLGSEYALKLVLAPSGEDRERLLREGRAQSMLRHRNIVPVLDAVAIGEDLGLVVELVDGPDLAHWLEGRTPDLPTIDRLAEDLFDGLAAAHARGFIHRDLKPSNVLIDGAHGDMTARIVDFGLTKDFTDASPTLTQSTVVFGSPAYAAPEQASGARTVDVRADIFSLGAMLYEILTGQRAFLGRTMLDMLHAAANERYLDPRELRADVPTRMVAAIQGALRADPDARVPDVASLRAIWSGLDTATVVPGAAPARRALADTTATLAPPPARPRGATWGLPAAVAVAVAVALLGWTATRPDAPAAAAPVAQAPSPRSAGDAPTPASAGSQDAPSPAAPLAERPAPTPPIPGAARPQRAATSPTVAAESALTAAAPPSAAEAPAPPAPAPSAPLPAPEVRLEGDAHEVVILGAGGQRVSPGPMDAGSYVVEARFQADEPRVAALRLDLRPGDVAVVTCYAGLRRCALRQSGAGQGR